MVAESWMQIRLLLASFLDGGKRCGERIDEWIDSRRWNNGNYDGGAICGLLIRCVKIALK